MKALSLLWLASLMLLLERVDCARILALLNIASPSHFVFNKVLIRALADRGHQVTALTPDIDKGVPLPNLKYIHLDGVYDNIKENFEPEKLHELTIFETISTFINLVSYTCEKSFESKGIQEILNYPSTEKFDLIITEAAWGECFLGFIHKFGYPPVVAVSAYGVVPQVGMAMGTSFNPAYMPNFLLEHSPENTFLRRLQNFLYHNLYIYMYYNKQLPQQEAMAKRYLQQDMPSFAEIQANYSIFLANILLGFDKPIPLSPNIIPVGGMHIKLKPDPLSKDLQTFLDEAKDGFIFFSLGTNLHSDALPLDKRKAIMEAFSELRQRVLWKFESDSLEGLPANVKIGKWLPQSDILAHPNIRIFISHCGKLSSLESTYRGVPMVGIPFFADQFFNLDILMSKGVAVRLDFTTLTKQSLLDAVHEILNNKSYQINAKKLSNTYQERQVSALDTAVFWTEYVIKHGDPSHLRPESASLPSYQFLLLDVILVLSTGALLIVFAVYYVIKKLYSLLFVVQPTDKKKIS